MRHKRKRDRNKGGRPSNTITQESSEGGGKVERQASETERGRVRQGTDGVEFGSVCLSIRVSVWMAWLFVCLSVGLTDRGTGWVAGGRQAGGVDDWMTGWLAG